MDLLITKIVSEIDLTDKEQELIRSCFTLEQLDKGELLINGEDFFNHIFFVEAGLLRVYLKETDGNEHLLQFAAEGCWVPDNFHQTKTSKFWNHIQAIEKTDVLVISHANFEKLLEDIPKLELYFRVVMQDRIADLHWRIINHLASFAEDSYSMFVKCYPDIAQRVPLYMIAAYLGLKPETLSRNRRDLATKNKLKPTDSHLLVKLFNTYKQSKK